MNPKDIEKLITDQSRKVSPNMKIVHDTTTFMDLEPGDVMILADAPYYIARNEVETGFGMDGDPKYWVKRVVDLLTGDIKIVKLVFFEEFTQKMGEMEVLFFRSPTKEAKVLSAVSDHPHFMHGTSVRDSGNNNVRIIDFIRGKSLNQMIYEVRAPHERYFTEHLPKFFPALCDCLESLSFIHHKGLLHGDVRWDHILFDRESGAFRWIDFDYHYDFPENPYGADLFGIGKILANVIGKGGYLYYDLRQDSRFAGFLDDLRLEDFSIMEQNRLMNLKKIFPYIPDSLNHVLLHFSGHAPSFYDSVDEIFDDLRDAMNDFCTA